MGWNVMRFLRNCWEVSGNRRVLGVDELAVYLTDRPLVHPVLWLVADSVTL